MAQDRLTTFWNGLLKKNIKWVRFIPETLLTDPVSRSLIANDPRSFSHLPASKKGKHADWYIRQCIAKDTYCDISLPEVRAVIQEVINTRGDDAKLKHTIHLMTSSQMDELFNKGRREYMLSSIPFELLPIQFMDRYIKSAPEMLYLIKVKLDSRLFNITIPERSIDTPFLNNLNKASYLVRKMADLNDAGQMQHYRKQQFFDQIMEKVIPSLEERLNKCKKYVWEDACKGVPIHTQIISFLMDVERLCEEWVESDKLTPISTLKDRYIQFENNETLSIMASCNDKETSETEYMIDINKTL